MTTHKTIVSVIVPVFNAAPFLPQALESFLAQTLKEIEIICVDDGSTDESPAILANFAARDPRLKVIRQANAGAAAARNRGMAEARGKWLSFLDADDVAAPDMFEKLHRRGEETDSEIVICRADFLYPDGSRKPINNALSDKLLPATEPFTAAETKNFLFTNPAVWNKLYRRDFIEQKNIRFQNLSSCNDVAFGILALAEAGKISTIPESLYCYRQDIAGNITAARSKHAENIVTAMNFVKNELEKRQLWQKYAELVYPRAAASFAYEYRLANICQKQKLLKPFKQFLPEPLFKRCFGGEHPLWGWLFQKKKNGDKRVLRILGIKISYRKKKKQKVSSQKDYLHFRGFNQLAYCIRRHLHLLPEEIDLVVGVPRSGIIPAYMIALFLNRPACSLNEFINGYRPENGDRPLKKSPIRKVLVVDDSVYSGSALRKTKQALEPLAGQYDLTYLCIYAHETADPKPDIFFENLPTPRLFQWNYLNHGIAGRACFDIDGVLCFDPTEEQNDDGEKYRDFLLHARPLYIPRYKIRALVTSRLEKYRPETEKWLRDNGVEYDQLYMLNLASKEERQKLGCHADFKAKIYKKLDDCILFVESNPAQAKRIAELSGKQTICVETDDMFGYCGEIS